MRPSEKAIELPPEIGVVVRDGIKRLNNEELGTVFRCYGLAPPITEEANKHYKECELEMRNRGLL